MAKFNLNSIKIPDFSCTHWKEYQRQVSTEVTHGVSSSSGMTESKQVSDVGDSAIKCKNISKKRTPAWKKSSIEEKLAHMYLKDPPLDENKMKNKNFVTCDFLEKLVYERNLNYLCLKIYPKWAVLSIRKPNKSGSIGAAKVYTKGEENYQEILNSVANKEIPLDLFHGFKNPHVVLLPDYHVILKTEEFVPILDHFEPISYTFNLLKPISNEINALLLETVRRETIEKSTRKRRKREIEPKLCVEMSGPLYLEVDEAFTLELINLFSSHKIFLEAKSTSLETVSNTNSASNEFNKNGITQEWIHRTFEHISSSSLELHLDEFLHLNRDSFDSKNNGQNPFKSLLILRNINEGYSMGLSRRLNMKLVEVFYFHASNEKDTIAQKKEYMQYKLLIFSKNGLFYIYCTEKIENVVHIDFFQHNTVNMVRIGNRTRLDKYIFNFAQSISERFNKHLVIERQWKLQNNTEEKEIFAEEELPSAVYDLMIERLWKDQKLVGEEDIFAAKELFFIINKHTPDDTPDMEMDSICEENVSQENFSLANSLPGEEIMQTSESIPSNNVEIASAIEYNVTSVEDVSDEEFTADKNEIANMDNGSGNFKTLYIGDLLKNHPTVQDGDAFEIEAEPSEPPEPFIYVSSVVKSGSVKTVFEAHKFEEKENTTQIQLLMDDSKEKIEVYRCLHEEFRYDPKDFYQKSVPEESESSESSSDYPTDSETSISDFDEKPVPERSESSESSSDDTTDSETSISGGEIRESSSIYLSDSENSTSGRNQEPVPDRSQIPGCSYLFPSDSETPKSGFNQEPVPDRSQIPGCSYFFSSDSETSKSGCNQEPFPERSQIPGSSSFFPSVSETAISGYDEEPVPERSESPDCSTDSENSFTMEDVEFIKTLTSAEPLGLSEPPKRIARKRHKKSRDTNDHSQLYFDYNLRKEELESLNNHLKFICNVFKPRSFRKGSTMPGVPKSSTK